MTTRNLFPRRRLAQLLLCGASACILSFLAFGAPARGARAAVVPPVPSDSVQKRANKPSLDAVRDSMLQRYPFLRRIQAKDKEGRLCDLFGRPLQGC